MACLIAFLTTYVLVLPAVTIDEETPLETMAEDPYLSFYDNSTCITVSVVTPKEAFPSGTYMVVTPIGEEEVSDSLNDVLDSDKNIRRKHKMGKYDKKIHISPKSHNIKIE